MVEQATAIPDPLIVAGLKAPGNASDNPFLRVHPSSSGVQHCEVLGMEDAIASKTPTWLRWATKSLSWEVLDRPIKHDAPVHPTVDKRFALAAVQQPEGLLPYRPAALSGHDKFKELYQHAQK